MSNEAEQIERKTKIVFARISSNPFRAVPMEEHSNQAYERLKGIDGACEQWLEDTMKDCADYHVPADFHLFVMEADMEFTGADNTVFHSYNELYRILNDEEWERVKTGQSILRENWEIDEEKIRAEEAEDAEAAQGN
jgi:hypothetical protein